MSSATLSLHTLTASTAARLLQRREISAEQLVRACLARIQAREPAIQAWAYLADAAALALARELDRGPLRGLLHGLPMGVKDLFDTADMPTAYGSAIYARHQPPSDAAVVALCRAAGAVVLGKTVTTELASVSAGKTHNPHRSGHTPGGSSSGSAAAVADFMVPLALGTQTAASVIRPAAFCGIVGFKPSYGVVTRAGIKSLSESLDTVGAFGRSVADVALLAAAITGDHSLMDVVPVGGARLGVCRTPEWPQADADTQAALQLGQKRLERAGVVLVDVALPSSMAALAQLQNDIMVYEMARSLSHERVCHAAAMSPALTTLLASGLAIDAAQHQRNQAAAAQARLLAAACFADCDGLLAPSTVGVAPVGLYPTGNPVFSRIWSLLGLPCVHLPFASGAHGLPVGLQIVGRFGDDRKTLQLAHGLHRHLRADTPP